MRALLASTLLAALAACADTRVAPSWPGSHLLVGERGDRTLAEIEPNSGWARRRYDAEGEPIAIAVSRNGQYGATLAENGLIVVRDLELERRDAAWVAPAESEPAAIVFADRRSTLLVGGGKDGALRFQRRDSGRDERVLSSGSASVRALALSFGGEVCAWAGCAEPAQLVRVDLERRALGKRIALPGVPLAIACANEGRELWVALAGETELAVVDVTRAEIVARFAVGAAPVALAAADAKGLVCASVPAEGVVVLVERASRAVVARIPLGSQAGEAWPVVVDPDARHAFVAIPAQDRIVVIDVATRAVRGSIATGPGPCALAWCFRRRELSNDFDTEPGPFLP